jgi:hypothetical protein
LAENKEDAMADWFPARGQNLADVCQKQELDRGVRTLARSGAFYIEVPDEIGFIYR